MTSLFSNTRFAFLLAKNKNQSLTDEDPPSAPLTELVRAYPHENRSALKVIWIVSAVFSLFMPILMRFIRMNKEDWVRLSQEESSGTLHFVYAWQTFMFLSIVVYGYHIIHTQKSYDMLIGALLVWFQYNFLAMLLLGDSMGGDDTELQRFYGQFSLLMFSTNAWYVIHGLIFTFIFAIRRAMWKHQQDQKQQQHQAKTNPTTTTSNVEGGPVTEKTIRDDIVNDGQYDYKRMDTPPSPTGSSDGDEDYIKIV